jgi:hypothetical protein
MTMITVQRHFIEEKTEILTKRVSQNISAQLQDRHPTPGGHLDSTNDHNLVGLDTPSPDPPFRLGVRIIRL